MVTKSAELSKPLPVQNEWLDRVRSWEVFHLADGTLSRGSLGLYRGKLLGEFLPWLASMGWQGLLEEVSVELLREYMLFLQDRD
jgi:hypothetical protein